MSSASETRYISWLNLLEGFALVLIVLFAARSIPSKQRNKIVIASVRCCIQLSILG